MLAHGSGIIRFSKNKSKMKKFSEAQKLFLVIFLIKIKKRNEFYRNSNKWQVL